jgi:hypothetical protein
MESELWRAACAWEKGGERVRQQPRLPASVLGCGQPRSSSSKCALGRR